MKSYMKTRIWDWIFCLVISTGLVFHIYSGFVLDEGLAQNTPLVILCMAVLCMVYILFSYKKITRIIGIIIVVAVIAAYILYAQTSGIFENESANYKSIALVITLATSFVCFLATRTKVGTIILLLAGNLICAGSKFLQFPVENWQMITFVIGVIAMLLYRTYMMTLMEVTRGKLRLNRYVSQSLIGLLLAVIISTIAFVAIIKPLNPPTRDLTLITKLEKMDVVSKIGISSLKEYLDPSLLAESQQEQLELAAKLEEQQKEEQQQEEEKEEEQLQQEGVQGKVKMHLYHYEFDQKQIPWLVILIAAILFALIFQWFFRRKRWKEAVGLLSYEGGIYNFYGFFLKALKKCGYKKPQNHTLYQYAQNLQHEMQAFDTESASFEDLTKVYIQVVYGEKEATREEYEMFEQYYNGFFKNMRKEIGFFKYLRKIWFLATA